MTDVMPERQAVDLDELADGEAGWRRTCWTRSTSS